MTPQEIAQYHKLLKIRESKTVELKPCPYLRSHLADGTAVHLRYYQVIGMYHLVQVPRMVLGDATGLGKCVTGDTLLATDRGLLPIAALAPVDDLRPDTFHEPAFPARVRVGRDLVPVKRFYWNGEAPTYKVRTRDGFEVTGSARHPLLVRGVAGEDFRRLPDAVVAEDYACIERGGGFAETAPSIPFQPRVAPYAKRYPVPEAVTPDLARLLGYIVAEGTVGSPHRTVITQHQDVNPEPHADIRGLLWDIFRWDSDKTNADRDKSIEVSSVWLRQYFEACGVDYTTAHAKSVPWCVMQGTREVVAGFLRGLFEGEGSVVSGGVEFSTASERLGKEVQLLLLQFGIVATRKPKLVQGYDHTYWRLTLFGENALLFHGQIGFASRRKQEALTQGLPSERNPNKDVVPHARELLERVRAVLAEAAFVPGANGDRRGSGLKQFGDAFQSKLSHVRAGNRNPTYAFLGEVYAACEAMGLLNAPAVVELRGVLQRRYYYDPVVEVTEAGVQPVMDIEVDDPRHAFTGNGLVNHNTLQAIGGLAYTLMVDPDARPIVVTTKVAQRQWESEILRFAQGVKVYVVSGGPEQRAAGYRAWKAHTGKDKPILVVTYHQLMRDWASGARTIKATKRGEKSTYIPGLVDGLLQDMPKIHTVFDEATAFKNSSSKTWAMCRELSDRSYKVQGLTATLLKNNLMEGFSIFGVIRPGTFGTKQSFLDAYCVVREQRVGNRRIPLVVGYRNLAMFRQQIDPFFLGRPKSVVADELPVLTTRKMTCTLGPAEVAKYEDALSGVLELGDGTVKDFEETKALTALIYCQQIVNSLAMLKFNKGDAVLSGEYRDEEAKVAVYGAKETLLLDVVAEELDGEKVIVYTRFQSLVGRLQEMLAKNGVKSTRITGKENTDQRKANQDVFQDASSDTRVIFITDAGSEAINLQTASAMVFYDAPWSWGAYVQALGRPQRIGSKHTRVLVYHLVAELPGDRAADRQTIDGYVLETLGDKKGMIDQVLGETVVGALTFEKPGSATHDLVSKLQQGAAQRRGKKNG